MKSWLRLPVPIPLVFELVFLSAWFYLLFHPALVDPKSYALALGAGLALLLLLPPDPRALPWGRPGWFFLLYAFSTSAWSLSPGISLQSSALLLLGFTLYALVRGLPDPAKGRLENLALAAAALAGLMGLLQWLVGFGPLVGFKPDSWLESEIVRGAMDLRRASASLATSGALAALMALFLPLAAARVAACRGPRRWAYALALACLVGGLLSAQSVGACLCLAVAGLAAAWRSGSRLWAGALALGGTLAVGTLILYRGWDHWIQASLGNRLSLWSSALGLFLENPFLGGGWGTFDQAYQQAGFTSGAGSRFAHSLPLQVLVEGGALGFLLLAWMVLDFSRRLKLPKDGEGLARAIGLGAFLLFTLLDLPFQMPELVWIFAAQAAFLPMAPPRPLSWPRPAGSWVEWGVLAVFLVSGFFPPYRPWNFCLLALALYFASAQGGPPWKKMPLGFLVGAAYLLARSLASPSALGTVRFLETAGILLAFASFVGSRPKPLEFLQRFFLLGLCWSALEWKAFLEDPEFTHWRVFPNQKHLMVFLVPLVLSLLASPGRAAWKWAVGLFSLGTMMALRATAALIGLGAGLYLHWKERKNRLLRGLLALVALLILAAFLWRALERPSTQWARLHIWKDTARIWLENPIFGVGPGAFEGLYHRFKTAQEGKASRYLMDARYAHSEPLEWLAAFGLLGILGAGWFLREWWKGRESGGRKPSVAALGVSSLWDFSLHTPLVALQGAGLMARGQYRPNPPSLPAGLLALGLGLGLFGAPLFVAPLLERARELKGEKKFQAALDCHRQAVRLNAWDYRVVRARADYLESLYLATGDGFRKSYSDDDMERVLDLEGTDGFLRLEAARRDGNRVFHGGGREALLAAVDSWEGAKAALPFSAQVRSEEGLFYMRIGREDLALESFKRAVELEPNDLGSWVNLALLLHRSGEGKRARRTLDLVRETRQSWVGKDIAQVEKDMILIPEEVLARAEGEMR